MVWVLGSISLLIAVFSFIIFCRRNGSHLAYPLWQFTALIMGTVFGTYAAILAMLVIILS